MNESADNRERSPYQQALDQQHVPAEKANETLRLMLAENHRLAAKEAEKAKKTGGKLQGLWRPVSMLAVAAAAFLLLFFGYLKPHGQQRLDFTGVQLGALPTAEVRSGESEPLSFSDAFHCEPGSLFPGWSVTQVDTIALSLPSGTFHEGSLTLEKEGCSLLSTVTDVEPPLFAAVTETQTLNGVALRLVLDETTGERAACWQKGALYLTVSAGSLDESAFLSALKQLVQP